MVSKNSDWKILGLIFSGIWLFVDIIIILTVSVCAATVIDIVYSSKAGDISSGWVLPKAELFKDNVVLKKKEKKKLVFCQKL